MTKLKGKAVSHDWKRFPCDSWAAEQIVQQTRFCLPPSPQGDGGPCQSPAALWCVSDPTCGDAPRGCAFYGFTLCFRDRRTKETRLTLSRKLQPLLKTQTSRRDKELEPIVDLWLGLLLLTFFHSSFALPSFVPLFPVSSTMLPSSLWVVYLSVAGMSSEISSAALMNGVIWTVFDWAMHLSASPTHEKQQTPPLAPPLKTATLFADERVLLITNRTMMDGWEFLFRCTCHKVKARASLGQFFSTNLLLISEPPKKLARIYVTCFAAIDMQTSIFYINKAPAARICQWESHYAPPICQTHRFWRISNDFSLNWMCRGFSKSNPLRQRLFWAVANSSCQP